MLFLGLASCRSNQSLGEPAVEVDGQVRSLLLGAAKRHHRHSARTGKRGDLLIGALSETHPLTLPYCSARGPLAAFGDAYRADPGCALSGPTISRMRLRVAGLVAVC